MISLTFFVFFRIRESMSTLTIQNRNRLHFEQISIENDTILICLPSTMPTCDYDQHFCYTEEFFISPSS